jgi:SAM-dependent methyltransferase
VFGAVFAPRPDVVAAELFRVVKPGGTVGLTAWGDYGVQAEVFRALSEFAPPPDQDLPIPREWGDEAIAEQRLAPLASSLRMERKSIPYEFDSFEDLWDVYLAAGPGAAAANAMPQETIEEAREKVRAIVERNNAAPGGAISLQADYLEIVARKRG